MKVCGYCRCRLADKLVAPTTGGTAKRRMCDRCIESRIAKGRKVKIFKPPK